MEKKKSKYIPDTDLVFVFDIVRHGARAPLKDLVVLNSQIVSKIYDERPP
jgi:hypothetical protein